jgi:hypothetical protein
MSTQQSGLPPSSRIYEVLKTVTLTAFTLFIAVIAVVVVSGRGEDASMPAAPNATDPASTVIATKGELQRYHLDAYRSLPITSPHWLYLVGSEAHAERLGA